MASIGNSPTQQAFTPAIDYFSGNGSTTAFTLSRPVASVAQVQVTIDNVAQNPSSAYTVSSNTITFTSAPLSGTNNIYVYYTSPITQVIAPGQGTVTSDSFGTITNFTTTGNTVLGDATTDTLTVGVTGIVKDASGNVGIGTASPTTYGATTKLAVVSSSTAGSWLVGGSNAGAYAYFSNNAQSATTNVFQIGQGWSTGSDNLCFLNSNGANPLMFATNGSERMRIDSSGNVLVGATTPYSGTVSNLTATTGVDIGSSSTATSKQLQFIRNGSTGTAGNIYATAGSFSNYCGVEFVIENVGGGSQAGYLKFNTTASATSNERMRITSGDNIRIGMQNYNAQPSASNYGVSLNNTNAGCNFFAGANGVQTHLVFGNLNGVVGSVQTNGSSTAFNTSSDYRLKEDVQPMTGALAKVARLKPVTYKWKADGSDGEGFIAHELKEVCPHAVNGEKDELDENGDIKPQGMDVSFLVATLTAAIQELSAKNDALTARIVALENR